MMFATLQNGGPDGQLVLMSADHARCADGPTATLQQLLESWDAHRPALDAIAESLAAGGGEPVDPARLIAPLPRAWQWLDGSAFPSHGALMQRAFKMPPIETDLAADVPGHVAPVFERARGRALSRAKPTGSISRANTGSSPMRCRWAMSPADAMAHIKLIVQINDWSLRTLAPDRDEDRLRLDPGEARVQHRAGCGDARYAWRCVAGRARVPAACASQWNGADVRPAQMGSEMAFGFHDLIAHAARTRSLPAGTIIGSGTVSNADYRSAGSTCVSEQPRDRDDRARCSPVTGFLRFGDRVRMEARSRRRRAAVRGDRPAGRPGLRPPMRVIVTGAAGLLGTAGRGASGGAA